MTVNYLDIDKFEFNDEALRGFIIHSIDEKKVNICNIQVKFQKNRAIVINLVTDDIDTIKYLNNEKIKQIGGAYYHYLFTATIDNQQAIGVHFPFYSFDIVVDLIEFSKNNIFFINSKDKFDLKIIPTQNMSDYIKRRKIVNLFNINEIVFENYNEKYRYLIELNSFIYNTPILIEKIYLKKNRDTNILFQSQHIDEKIEKGLVEIYPLLKNGHFEPKLDKYLDNFVELKNNEDTLSLLFKIYLILDMYNGKKDYNLNDISGFVDLFDGIFFNLNGKLEKQKFICAECKKEKKTKRKTKSLKDKINFVLEQLEPELKNYEIDQNKKLSEILSSFRNTIRHQLSFKGYDLGKLMTFSEGVLRLYAIKHILKVENTDYDIDRILQDFNIYPLVKHKYKYLDNEIVIYNTQLDNYGHQILSENTTYYQTLKEQNIFHKAQPKDFIYDGFKELKKIYIDDDDTIKRSLIFFGTIVFNKTILKSSHNSYLTDNDYAELKKELGV